MGHLYPVVHLVALEAARSLGQAAGLAGHMAGAEVGLERMAPVGRGGWEG